MRVEPLLPAPSRQSIAVELLAWYDTHARTLPWRLLPGHGTPDPWAVLLSEVMLQQTTVATVAPRFAAFRSRWPSAEALAATPLADLLEAWAGLGYYARARNLHAAARAIAASGQFPRTQAGLAALPGLGPYTAAAVAAIAFGEPVAVVDGNVERVMARLLGLEALPPRLRDDVASRLAPLVPVGRPGDFAQAMMDLGATVCTPRTPDCGCCPLHATCVANATGCQALLPRRRLRAARPLRHGTAWWIEADGAVALVRRPPTGLLGGMLALPGSDWSDRPAPVPLPFPAPWRRAHTPVRHVFTHFELRLDLAAVRLAARPLLPFAADWTPLACLAGLPSLYRKAAAVAGQILETT